jgi:hypothetical protein
MMLVSESLSDRLPPFAGLAAVRASLATLASV